MLKTTFCSLAFGLAATSLVMAVDSDPGYGPRPDNEARVVTVGRRGSERAPRIGYLKPTQRYYGKGYVVAYRYVPWNDRMRYAESTSFQGSSFNLPANASASVVGGSPRVTRYYNSAKKASYTPVTVSTPVSTPASAPVPATTGTAAEPVKPVPPIAQ